MQTLIQSTVNKKELWIVSRTTPLGLVFHYHFIYLDSSSLFSLFAKSQHPFLAATIFKFHEAFGILVIQSVSAKHIILSRINEFYLVKQHGLISVRPGDFHFSKESCMEGFLKTYRTPFGVSSCMNFSCWYSLNRCKIVLTKCLSGIIYTW